MMSRIEKDLIDEIMLLNERVNRLSNSLRVAIVVGTFITIALIAVLVKGGVL